MIYTETENRRWWDGLTLYSRDALIDRIIELAEAPTTQSWIRDVAVKVSRGNYQPDASALVKLRQWSNE